MILSDTDILQAAKDGDITLETFDKKRVQPASYDVLLGNTFAVFETHTCDPIDPVKKVAPHTRTITVGDKEKFVLNPGHMVLGQLRDFVGSDKYLIQLSGKSSLARIGLVVHNTAGLINPGHYLNITLELFNVNQVPIILRPGMEIAQLTFTELSGAPRTDYRKKGRFSKDNWKNFAPKKNQVEKKKTSKKAKK